MRSWERIFDLELLKTHLEWTSGEILQACIEKIYMDEDVDIAVVVADKLNPNKVEKSLDLRASDWCS